MQREKLHIEDIQKTWLNSYREYIQNANGNIPSPIKQIQEKAMEQFMLTGFPTTKHEEWKYTSVKPLLQKQFIASSGVANEALAKAHLENLKIPSLDSNLIVFIDGIYMPGLSNWKEKSETASFSSIKQAKSEADHSFIAHYGKYADSKENPFTALNTALSRDGILIKVHKSQKLQYPIECLHIFTSKHKPEGHHTRMLLIAEENSNLAMLERSYTVGEAESWKNQVVEILLKDNAHATFYQLQEDNAKGNIISNINVLQQQNSRFTSFSINLSEGWLRNNLNIKLNGKGAEAHMYGLYLTEKQAFVDNHTFVDHAVPNCYSNELYKGVLNGKSTAVFNGKIMVRPDAQKTNAFQSNKNILLSPHTTINTKPQLEIFADDVKCSHGATTGKLNPEALFYLKARGINEARAKALLINAFSQEITEKISLDALRAYIEKQTQQKLLIID